MIIILNSTAWPFEIRMSMAVFRAVALFEHVEAARSRLHLPVLSSLVDHAENWLDCINWIPNNSIELSTSIRFFNFSIFQPQETWFHQSFAYFLCKSWPHHFHIGDRKTNQSLTKLEQIIKYYIKLRKVSYDLQVNLSLLLNESILESIYYFNAEITGTETLFDHGIFFR